MNFIGASSYWLIFILYLLGHAGAAPYLMAGEVGGWNSLTSSSAFCILFLFFLCFRCQAYDGYVEVDNAWKFSADCITFITCSKACTGQSIICEWTKQTVRDFLISALSCPSRWSLEIYSFYLQILQLKIFFRELHDCNLIILLTGFKYFCKNEYFMQQCVQNDFLN